MRTFIDLVVFGCGGAVLFVVVFFTLQSLVHLAPEQMFSYTVFMQNLTRLF